MKLRHAIVAAICGGVLMLAAVPGAQAHMATPADGVPSFGNVFMIIGENTTYGELTPQDAPYILGTLQPNSAFLSTYFATTHNSLANYVALMSGQYTVCEQNDNSPEDCHQPVNNLFSQLDASGISWHEWMESAVTPCQITKTGTDAALNKYRPKHNPAVYFGKIEGAGHTFSTTQMSKECRKNVVPAGSLAPNDTSNLDTALSTGNVPRFNLIIPNMCEDSHDDCPPIGHPNGRIAQFDQFLAREIPKIQASPAYTADSAILVVWDEADAEGTHGDPNYGGGQVGWYLESPLAQPGIYSGLTNHYSTLRMLEDGFGLSGQYLGGAATANPVPSGIWK